MRLSRAIIASPCKTRWMDALLTSARQGAGSVGQGGSIGAFIATASDAPNAGVLTPRFAGLDPNAVIYDWLAPVWGWANPGTIATKGWRVVSTRGLYLSSNQDNTDWTSYYHVHPLSSTMNSTQPHDHGWYNVTDDAQKKRVLGGEVRT